MTSLQSKAQAARKILSGLPAPAPDDSEDELLKDSPPEWEWIYSSGGNAPEAASEAHPQSRHENSSHIVAARIGKQVFRLGDAVTLKADRNDVWVALITGFVDGSNSDSEDEDDISDAEDGPRGRCARFMWLSSPKEIYNKSKRRNDALPNELYATASSDINPLEAILGRAIICSQSAFRAKYPNGKVPRTSPDFNRIFVCRMGANLRTATYTEPFTWEEIYRGAEDLEKLMEKIDSETKATRKRKASEDKPYKEMEAFVATGGVEEEDDDGLPETPRKRQKHSHQAATPSRSKQHHAIPNKLLTPTHRRIVTKRPLEFTPLGTRLLPSTLDPSSPLSTPSAQARTRLHVSAVPTSLPCREEEFSTVYSYLESAITLGTGACIYISGTPGTGKTATVREVVAQLHASVQAEELDDFAFVEINGLKVTDPHQSYALLWECVSGGQRVAPSHALSLLSAEFSRPSPRRVPVVVLMDELDSLVTRTQSVMYNFFNWPQLRHSRLIVLAVANTMDLPERTLSNKISSRLGLTRITFQGYTHQQLMQIIEARLKDVPGTVVESDAVQFASRKVAQVSGDARRALDICRRAVEIAEHDIEVANAKDSAQTEGRADEDLAPDTPSKRGRHLSKPTPTRPVAQGEVRVTIQTIQRAIREATSSPLQIHLRHLPLASKVFLAALLARNRRTGIAETTLGDVLDEAKKLGSMTTCEGMKEWLMLESTSPAQRGPNKLEAEGLCAMPSSKGRTVRQARLRAQQEKCATPVPRVLGMVAAASELLEAGVIVVEARRGERTPRVRLQVGEDDLKQALKDDAEVGGMGFRS